MNHRGTEEGKVTSTLQQLRPDFSINPDASANNFPAQFIEYLLCVSVPLWFIFQSASAWQDVYNVQVAAALYRRPPWGPLFILSPDPLSFFNCSMREQSLSFLRTLVNTPSPVGHEVRGQRVWLDYAKEFAEETFSDAYGNCVAVLHKGGSPRLMLAGHADEIAMAVNYITDEGFIHVRKMGGVDAAITKAQRILIHTRNGPVKGVVGNVAPHLMKEEKDPKPPKIHDLFIDVGVSSRADAEKILRVGDPITLADEFDLLRNDLAVARAFDNRIGTFAVAEALRLLHSAGRDKTKLQAEVCAVSNVQEEVGLLGARQIAYSLKPDIALVVDVTHATDYPTVNKPQHGDVRI